MFLRLLQIISEHLELNNFCKHEQDETLLVKPEFHLAYLKTI